MGLINGRESAPLLGISLYGAPLVLPNQYLSINNDQTMNEFVIQIDSILRNLPMTRQNTAAEDLRPRTGSGYVAAATRPSTSSRTPSSSAASATYGSRWATGRTTSPPPGSSPAPTEPPSRTGGSSPIPRRRPSASALTSLPPHHQLPLEPFFLASLPGFLHAQGKHL